MSSPSSSRSTGQWHATNLKLPSKTGSLPTDIIFQSTTLPRVQTPVARARDSLSARRRTKPIKAKKTSDPILSQPISVLTENMSHIPVRNMRAWVTRDIETRHKEIQKNGYISRPMNSFMLYRSAYAERIKAWCAETNHQVVSKVSGQSWFKESAHIRQEYQSLAQIEQQNHHIAHPDYKFMPKKTVKHPVDERGGKQELNRVNTRRSVSASSEKIKTPESSSSFSSRRSIPPGNRDYLLDTYDISAWQLPESRSPVIPHVSPSNEAGSLMGYNGLSPGRGQDLTNVHYNTTGSTGTSGGIHHELEQSYPSGHTANHLDGPQLYPQLLRLEFPGDHLYSVNELGAWQMNQIMNPNFSLTITGYETMGMYTTGLEENNTM